MLSSTRRFLIHLCFGEFAGSVGQNKHKLNIGGTWTHGKWRWNNQFRYFSNGDISRDNDFNIGGWGVWDTSIGYELNDYVDLQLNIDNVTDRSAPMLAGLQSDAIMSTYYSGILGRYTTLSVRGRF